MKRLQLPALILLALVAIVGCKNEDFKKTSSGLMYKIFDGGVKDSTKIGSILKMNQSVRLSGSKDSLLGETYGQMPVFAPVQPLNNVPGQPPVYDPSEIYHLLKKGDSAVVVLYVDSLISKGLAQEAQLPPMFKKGDKVTFTFKVLDVFANDSLARIDYQKEGEAFQNRMIEQQRTDSIAYQKSGGDAGALKAMEEHLKKKNIAATKTQLGTFVKIDNPGTGAPVANGKFVTVKYAGKTVNGDKPFDSGTIEAAQIGAGGTIPGFEDGLKQFKEGGKGVVYIPGFLAYTQGVPPGAPFKAFDPLYFEVEIVKVADAPPQQQMPQMQMPEVPHVDSTSKK